MKILAVIPARYASSRFPGKPLVKLAGKTIIQRVWESASQVEQIDKLLVATDDDRIARHVRAFGGEAIMTADTHRSGTDRIAEVARQFTAFEGVVNIQGDEPFVRKDQLKLLVQTLQREDTDIATLAFRIQETEGLFNPHVVKVVMNRFGQAMYFSRSPIPYIRDQEQSEWVKAQSHFQHIGLYAFRQKVLLEISSLLPSPYEALESLEQLRWLDVGKRIRVALTDYHGFGIDTPEDLVKAEQYIKQNGESSNLS